MWDYKCCAYCPVPQYRITPLFNNFFLKYEHDYAFFRFATNWFIFTSSEIVLDLILVETPAVNSHNALHTGECHTKWEPIATRWSFFTVGDPGLVQGQSSTPQPPKAKVSMLSWSQGVTRRCQHSTWSGLSTLTTCTLTTAALTLLYTLSHRLWLWD